jgi:hypothetical protein
MFLFSIVFSSGQIGTRKRIARCLLTLAAIAPCLLGQAADAATVSGRLAAQAAFTVRGTNGFTIDVASEAGVVKIAASERRPPIATFSSRGQLRPAVDVNGAASVYYVRGAGSDPSEVDAQLGTMGRISVGFRPSGETRVSLVRSGACSRPIRIVRRLGAFTGTIEFRGEGGYTSVVTTAARGSVGTPPPSGCTPARASRPGFGAAELRAVNSRAGTSFRATTTARGVAFVATFAERLGDGLVVSRRAFAGAPLGTFAFDPRLISARVRPPAPFGGVGRFDAGGQGRGRVWSGNLRVTFPGISVPMTGPGFRPSLRSGR